SHSPSPSRDRAHGFMPHGGTSPLLSVHFVRVRVRRGCVASRSQLYPDGRARSGHALICIDSVLRTSFRPTWTQTNIYVRSGSRRFLRVCLLPAARHPDAVLGGNRNRALVGAARHNVRPASCLDRGVLSGTPPL